MLPNLTKETIMSNENMVPETMNILVSMQAREQLLESLNLRINTSQVEVSPQVQEWIGDLKEQQLSDIDLYKNNLLLSGQSQSRQPQHEITDRISIDRPEPVSNKQDNWSEQFADGFIAHLDSENSLLLDLWLGQKHSYPHYIGFDIRRSEDSFDFFGSDTYWLAANLRERQVSAGIHFRDPLYFQELEAQKSQIDIDFSREFGGALNWRPTTGNAGIYRINVLVGVDHYHSPNPLFEDLCKILEKLDEIFKDRLERISQLLSTSFTRSYNH